MDDSSSPFSFVEFNALVFQQAYSKARSQLPEYLQKHASWGEADRALSQVLDSVAEIKHDFEGVVAKYNEQDMLLQRYCAASEKILRESERTKLEYEERIRMLEESLLDVNEGQEKNMQNSSESKSVLDERQRLAKENQRLEDEVELLSSQLDEINKELSKVTFQKNTLHTQLDERSHITHGGVTNSEHRECKLKQRDLEIKYNGLELEHRQAVESIRQIEMIHRDELASKSNEVEHWKGECQSLRSTLHMTIIEKEAAEVQLMQLRKSHDQGRSLKPETIEIRSVSPSILAPIRSGSHSPYLVRSTSPSIHSQGLWTQDSYASESNHPDSYQRRLDNLIEMNQAVHTRIQSMRSKLTTPSPVLHSHTRKESAD